LWDLILIQWKEKRFTKKEFYISSINICLIFWLLYMAQSATSIACTFFAACLFLVCRKPSFVKKPEKVITFIIVTIAFLVITEAIFGVSELAITSLGRESDLTGRSTVWEYVIDLANNPIIGSGYEIFWAGERMAKMWQEFGVILQAHNGYIDVYLNVGIIGLMLLLISIILFFLNLRRNLYHEYGFTILKLAFVLATVLYNWTEAAFKPLNNIFVVFLVSTINMPKKQKISIKLHNDEK
jgi:O-antigen ligase